jgi:hypothetical protein
MTKKAAVLFLILSVTLIFAAATYADPATSMISGRLAATYDSKTATLTAMVAGYCEGQPVTIGPATWTVGEWEFESINAEDIGKKLCGNDFSVKKVTKSVKNSKEIVADVLILRQ